MKKRLISLITVFLLLLSFPTAAIAGSIDVQNNEHPTTTSQQSENNLEDYSFPPIPEGYSYYGDCLTDVNGVTIYYVCRPAGESGVSRGYWIDQNGDQVINNPEAEDLIPTTDFINNSTGKQDEKSIKGSTTFDVDRETTDLPSSYDARDLGYVTGFEYQIGGTCWAMASIAAIETNAIKQGLAVNTLDLNEYVSIWNGRNGYYNDESAANNSLNDGYVSDDIYKMIANGGYPTYIGYAVLNFSGAVKESTIPRSGNNINDLNASLTKSLNISNKYQRDITVEEIITIANKESAIKKALLDYGGIYIAFASVSGAKAEVVDNEKNYTTYYTGKSSANGYHAVEMIGWDDNFPKEYFTQTNKPSNDGAWLCKNSYGTGWGNMGGYFWLSYEEPSIYGATAFKVADPDEFDTVFMYDGVGYSATVTATKAANIFTADKKSTITKFSLGYKTAVDYTLSIYKLNKNHTSPTDGKLLYTQSGKTSGKMWTNLDENVTIDSGCCFSVVIEGISKCYAEGKSSSSKKYTSNEGESFYYTGSEWVDSALQLDNNSIKKYNNICIRVAGCHVHTYNNDYNYSDNGTHSHKCIYCNDCVEAEACTPVKTERVVGKDCCTEGYDTYVCRKCGHEYTESNGKFGAHNYENNRCTICDKTRSTILVQSVKTLFNNFFKSFSSVFQNLFNLFK